MLSLALVVLKDSVLGPGLGLKAQILGLSLGLKSSSPWSSKDLHRGPTTKAKDK